MFTTDLGNLYNRNIFKTSLYIYTFQDEKCRLMRNLSLSMVVTHHPREEMVREIRLKTLKSDIPRKVIQRLKMLSKVSKKYWLVWATKE